MRGSKASDVIYIVMDQIRLSFDKKILRNFAMIHSRWCRLGSDFFLLLSALLVCFEKKIPNSNEFSLNLKP